MLHCISPVLALSGGSQDGEFTSAFGGVAEVHGRTASAAFDANAPKRPLADARAHLNVMELRKPRYAARLCSVVSRCLSRGVRNAMPGVMVAGGRHAQEKVQLYRNGEAIYARLSCLYLSECKRSEGAGDLLERYASYFHGVSTLSSTQRTGHSSSSRVKDRLRESWSRSSLRWRRPRGGMTAQDTSRCASTVCEAPSILACLSMGELRKVSMSGCLKQGGSTKAR
jgi:hypothetical protein